MKEKVFFQIILERNPSNSFYIFLLDVDFENLTVELHILIIFFILAKFQKKKNVSIIMLTINCLHFLFCDILH